MADEAKHEMLSAFASGCLGKENLDYFIDYLEKGGELPPKELGELQNIMALIPVILETEKPDPKVKQRVAKRLLSLQDEIKAKIKEQKKKAGVTTVKEAESKTVAQKNKTEEKKKEKPASTQKENEVSKTPQVQNMAAEPEPLAEEQMNERINKRRNELRAESEEDQITSKRFWTLGTALILLVTAIGVVIVLLYNSVSNDVDETRQELADLKAEVEVNAEFRMNYLTIIDFFNNPDIRMMKFRRSAQNVQGSGKLFAADDGSGLLQLSNMPILPEGQAYQMWVYSNNIMYPFGMYLPKPGKVFWEVYNLPESSSPIDSIKITGEPLGGSDSPSGRILLFFKQDS